MSTTLDICSFSQKKWCFYDKQIGSTIIFECQIYFELDKSSTPEIQTSSYESKLINYKPTTNHNSSDSNLPICDKIIIVINEITNNLRLRIRITRI